MKEKFKNYRNKTNFQLEVEVTEGRDEGKVVFVYVSNFMFRVKVFSKYLPSYFTYPLTNKTKLSVLSKIKDYLLGK